jgi:hypothetical protein
MALGSTQPLTEMSTRNLPGGNVNTICNNSFPFIAIDFTLAAQRARPYLEQILKIYPLFHLQELDHQ